MKAKQLRTTASGISCSLIGLVVLGILLPALHAQQTPRAKPLKQDGACLACHGQAGMKSEKGRDISIHPEKHAASAHGILGCKDCHTNIKDFPHPEKIAKVECHTCHSEQWSDVSASIHIVLGDAACSSCHGNVHEVSAAAEISPAKELTAEFDTWVKWAQALRR